MDVGPANKEDAVMPLAHCLWGQQPSTEVLRHSLRAAVISWEVTQGQAHKQTNKQTSEALRAAHDKGLVVRGELKRERICKFSFSCGLGFSVAAGVKNLCEIILPCFKLSWDKLHRILGCQS